MQESDARRCLGITVFIDPPADIQTLWGQIPSELAALSDYLLPVQNWLAVHAKPHDCVLVQGDFGACFLIAQMAFRLNLVAIYATTRREAVEEHLPDGSVRLTHQFRHVIFRKYEHLLSAPCQ